MRRAAILLAIVALIAAPATVLAAEPYTAELTPEAEVPPVTADGSGSASVTISDDESSIDYEVSYQDLTGPATAAHIHYGDVDEAGGVILPLEVGDSPFSGTLTEADFTPLDGGPQTWGDALAAIRDGLTYVNVHTDANQGGEIRGQLQALPDTATATDGPTAMLSMSWLILALIGLATFVVVLRRFALRRA